MTMECRLLDSADGHRTLVVVGEPGDDAVEIINRVARDRDITAAS